MTMESFLAAVMPIVFTAVGVVAINLFAVLVKYLKTKTQNAKVEYALDVVAQMATNVVRALNQSYVNDLKSHSEDGKLTKDEISDINDKSLGLLKSLLSSEIKTVITETVTDGNLDMYLGSAIESAVVDSKNMDFNA